MKFTLATLLALSAISSGALGAAIPKPERTVPALIVALEEPLIELDDRGLVDSLTGALPGLLSLVTGLVTGLVSVVGSVVGSLLLDEPGSSVSVPSSTNSTQVYLVQVNSTLSNATSDPSTTLVQIHAPVYNQTDMSLMDLCLAYANATSLAATPCRADAAEQLFTYNSTSYEVRPAMAVACPVPAAASSSSSSAAAAAGATGLPEEIIIERDTADATTSCNGPTMSIIFTPAVTDSIIRVAPVLVASPSGSASNMSMAGNITQQD